MRLQIDDAVEQFGGQFANLLGVFGELFLAPAVGHAFQNGDVGGGVYRSPDAGMTWTRIDAREHRLPSMQIWALALDMRDQNTLFVGSHSAGVYVVSRGAEASLNSVR